MRSFRTSALVAASIGCFSLSSLAAQTASPTETIPKGYLNKEGPISQWAAYHYAPGRQQNLYRPEVVGLDQAAMTFTDLWIRGDGQWGRAIKHSFTLEVLISSDGANYSNPTRTSFDANHGKDKKVFMKKTLIHFPGWSKSSPTVRPFDMRFKGDAPFKALKGKGLCVDVKSYSTSSAALDYTWYADGTWWSPIDTGGFKTVGAACPVNFDHMAEGMYVGGKDAFSTYGRSRGKGDLVLQWLSHSKVSIPVGLFGKDPCTLTANLENLHPQVRFTTSNSGTARFYWDELPTAMGGRTVYSQMGAIDPAGALKLSSTIEIRIGKGWTREPAPYWVVYDFSAHGYPFDPDKSVPRFGPHNHALILGRN